jgi:hypothetical protein
LKKIWTWPKPTDGRRLAVLFVGLLLGMIAVLSIVLCLRAALSLEADAATDASLWLSAAAYCDKTTYLTRTYLGPTNGFIPTYSIYDSKTDTTGYLGYLPSQNTIFVIFRGSVSWKNWASDLDAIKTNYTSYPECQCQVLSISSLSYSFFFLIQLFSLFSFPLFFEGSQRILSS